MDSRIKTITYTGDDGKERVVTIKPFRLGLGAKILKKASELADKAKTNEDYRYALNTIVIELTNMIEGKQNETSDIGFAAMLISVSTICYDLYTEILDLAAEIFNSTPEDIEEMEPQHLELLWKTVFEVNEVGVMGNLLKNSKDILLRKAQEIAMSNKQDQSN